MMAGAPKSPAEIEKELIQELRALVKASSASSLLPDQPAPQGLFGKVTAEPQFMSVLRAMAEDADENRVSHLVLKARYNALVEFLEKGLSGVENQPIDIRGELQADVARRLAKINLGIREQLIQPNIQIATMERTR